MNSVNYTLKRAQAQRNAESHIAALLYGAAKRIVALAQTYRVGVMDISTSKEFIEQARRIAEEVQEEIEAYIRAYAKASAKLLGISAEGVTAYLAGQIFGKTFVERNRAYVANFAQDIIRMVTAGIRMGYTQSQLLSAVRTGYRQPFKASVITKAQRKGIAIDTPSYGRGVFHSAYKNIIRNAQATISLTWGEAQREYGEESGAIGFWVFRGSSYPCETCQSQVGYVHKLTDPMPPYHLNCVCGVTFIYNSKQE